MIRDTLVRTKYTGKSVCSVTNGVCHKRRQDYQSLALGRQLRPHYMPGVPARFGLTLHILITPCLVFDKDYHWCDSLYNLVRVLISIKSSNTKHVGHINLSGPICFITQTHFMQNVMFMLLRALEICVTI